MEQQRENREQMRERVIVAASKAFLEKGVKAVTMDHVARVLKMSKRTIYQLFKDKEALLLACYEKQHKQDQAMMERMAANAGNVLEALLEIFAYRMRTVGALRPSHFEGVSSMTPSMSSVAPLLSKTASGPLPLWPTVSSRAYSAKG